MTPDGERSRVAYWYEDTPKVELDQAMLRSGKVCSALMPMGSRT